MIARSLKAKPVTSRQRIRHESQRPPAADRILGGVRARSVRNLIILAVSLIDLHHRLHNRIIVAPVRPHVGPRGMNRGDTVKIAQVFVEHLRVRRRAGRRILGRFREPRQRTHATLGHDHVAVTLGIPHAALVAERRHELPLDVEGVGHFLRQPPGVLAAVSVVMVATAKTNPYRRRPSCSAKRPLNPRRLRRPR